MARNPEFKRGQLGMGEDLMKLVCSWSRCSFRFAAWHEDGYVDDDVWETRESASQDPLQDLREAPDEVVGSRRVASRFVLGLSRCDQ